MKDLDTESFKPLQCILKRTILCIKSSNTAFRQLSCTPKWPPRRRFSSINWVLEVSWGLSCPQFPSCVTLSGLLPTREQRSMCRPDHFQSQILLGEAESQLKMEQLLSQPSWPQQWAQRNTTLLWATPHQLQSGPTTTAQGKPLMMLLVIAFLPESAGTGNS